MYVKCYFEEGKPVVVSCKSLRAALAYAKAFRAREDRPVLEACLREEDCARRLAVLRRLTRRRRLLKFQVWR
jgi:hypothetical protein